MDVIFYDYTNKKEMESTFIDVNQNPNLIRYNIDFKNLKVFLPIQHDSNNQFVLLS